MGQEIAATRFSERDFSRFRERLSEETALLCRWLREGRMQAQKNKIGIELEAWLTDAAYAPSPTNAVYIERLALPQVVPELARFNVELNSQPRNLQGKALCCLHEELQETWQQARKVAEQMDLHLLMVGILPSVPEAALNLSNMSPLKRYHALNEQVMRQRQGHPLRLHIHGREDLQTEHYDLMLEAAATSLQIHLQVPQELAVRAYNASLILSAPMVAAGANSPYLFGKSLWEETRIPLFEQAVDVGGYNNAARGPIHRVSFGSAYLRESLAECFEENLAHYPPLLPVELEEAPEKLAHLRLHNGTIWRWNRPLVDFSGGQPHVRIEHRVIAAGPSVLDVVANVALYLGLVQILMHQSKAPESLLRFDQARDNFYAAAKEGLQARVTWLDGRRYVLGKLLQEDLLPLARQGLSEWGLDSGDARRYLDVIAQRLHSGQTGSAWQRAFVTRHGADMRALTAAYNRHQCSGLPVHAWEVEGR